MPLIFLCLLQSCAKNSEEDLIVDTPLTADTSQTENFKSFASDVQPILNKHCVSCHNTQNPSGSVNLETYNKVKIIVVPKNSESSLLYGVISHTAGYPMPPSGSKIPQQEIDIIKDWIDEGALDN